MQRTRGEVWFFAFLGFFVAVVQLLRLRNELWPQLGVLDWFVLILLLVSPPIALWHYLRHVREMSNEVFNTGFRLVMGGYVPLWFGFTLVRRVLNG